MLKNKGHSYESLKVHCPPIGLALIMSFSLACICFSPRAEERIAEIEGELGGNKAEEPTAEEESEDEETVTEPESLTDPEPVTDPENEVNELEPGIDISGTWSGNMTITEGEGHFDDSVVGEPKPLEFVIKEEPDGSYTVHFSMLTAPVFYDPVAGTIEFTFIFVEDYKTEYTGVVAREDDLWTMQGNMNEQGPDGYYRKGNWHVEKQD